jgi:IPT/TIG domain
MSRAREVSKVTATVASLSASVADFDAVAYSSASPSGAQTGDLWVDTSTENPLIKAYDGTEWDTLGSAPVPIITGIAPDNIAGTASTAVIINGSNFESGSIVKLIDINSTELFTLSTAFNNATSLQFLTPALTASAGPYDIKVTNPDNQLSILENALTVGTTPTWVTNAGSLGLIYDSVRSSTTFTLIATDADNHTITYSIVSGSLPTGMTMTNQGVISGTAQAVASDTTYAFTIRATDTTSAFNERSFSITTKAPIVQSFTSVGTTTWSSPLNGNIQVLVVGGGGGGGETIGGGGGAGAYVYNASFPVISGLYTVTVGGGGLGGFTGVTTSAGYARGNSGDNSVFGSITAIGGGGGGGYNDTALNGGSGGGIGAGDASSARSGVGGQGNSGGVSNNNSNSGAGGGGAGGVGVNASNGSCGAGGPGVSNSISGVATFYAAGGGGGARISGGGNGAVGGSGIGGTGNTGGSGTAGSGATNTGSGGGGGGYTDAGGAEGRGGNGGSGVVILRY